MRWCEMYDEMDNYVGRSLKNWAARQRPPVDGRQRLLQAASQPAYEKPGKIIHLLSFLIRRDDTFERLIYPQSDWQVGPALSNYALSFYNVANWRLVY